MAFAFIEKIALFLMYLITTNINILWLILLILSSFYPKLKKKPTNVAWKEKKIQQNKDHN